MCKFVVKNNVPYLYINDSLVATGVSPSSTPSGNITTLATNGCVGSGAYGSYKGTANNIVLYNCFLKRTIIFLNLLDIYE